MKPAVVRSTCDVDRHNSRSSCRRITRRDSPSFHVAIKSSLKLLVPEDRFVCRLSAGESVGSTGELRAGYRCSPEI